MSGQDYIKPKPKQQCQEYGWLFTSAENQKLYEKLLDQAFYSENQPKGNICVYQSPLFYSFKYTKERKQTQLRVVVEPFSGQKTSKQVQASLALMKELNRLLQWNIEPDMNQLASLLFPKNPSEMDLWKGGLWVGMEGDGGIKAYFTLRHQPKRTRWQKIANIMSLYAQPQMETVIRRLLAEIGECGILVGVGAGFNSHGIAGLRLYFSFDKESSASAKILLSLYGLDDNGALDQFKSCISNFFPYEPSSLLSLDFKLNEHKKLSSNVDRIKMEISLCGLEWKLQRAAQKWIEYCMKSFKLPEQSFLEDLKHTKDIFPDIFYQYCSLGIGKTGTHFTVYFEPIWEDTLG